jgi:Flp pilus assembly protein CpaB
MSRPSSARPSTETTPSWAAGVRRRIPFYLTLALLAAALAGILTFVYLDRLRAAAVPTRLAIVARQEIRPGTLLDETMVESRPVPEAVLPSNALSSVADAAGRVAIVPLVANEVLLTSKWLAANSGCLRLPDGRWAMVLPRVDGNPASGGHPGDRLDLLAYQPGAPIAEAVIVVTEVEVIDPPVDAAIADGLVLAVTIDQAAAVVYARGNGFLLLPLLRPQGS